MYDGFYVALPELLQTLLEVQDKELVIQAGHAPALYRAAIVLRQVPVGSLPCLCACVCDMMICLLRVRQLISTVVSWRGRILLSL